MLLFISKFRQGDPAYVVPDDTLGTAVNNMVELVRDIRSSYGYIDGDFQTFALDIGSIEYDAFILAIQKRLYGLPLPYTYDGLTEAHC